MLQKRFLFQLGICCNLLVLSVWFTTRYWRFHMSDTRPLATASNSRETFRIQFRKLICISNNALPAFLPIWCLGMCLRVSAVFLLYTNMRFWTISYGDTTYPLHSQKSDSDFYIRFSEEKKNQYLFRKVDQIIVRSDLIKHDVISCLEVRKSRNDFFK